MAGNKSKNRKRNQGRNAQAKRDGIGSILKVMITFVVIIIAAVIILAGSVKVKVGDTGVDFSATLSGSASVEYDDIKSITYEKNIETGNRNFGIGSVKLQAGKFENDAYGKYKLFSYAKCEEYIVIETAKDGYIVVNKKTPKETKKLYKELRSKLGESLV